jgi:hypothetical protein
MWNCWMMIHFRYLEPTYISIVTLGLMHRTWQDASNGRAMSTWIGTESQLSRAPCRLARCCSEFHMSVMYMD